MKYIFIIALLFGFVGMTYSNTLSTEVGIEKADVIKSDISETFTYVVEVSPVVEIVVDVGKSDISNLFTKPFIEFDLYHSNTDTIIGDYRCESISFNYNYNMEISNLKTYRRSRDGLSCGLN